MMRELFFKQPHELGKFACSTCKHARISWDVYFIGLVQGGAASLNLFAAIYSATHDWRGHSAWYAMINLLVGMFLLAAFVDTLSRRYRSAKCRRDWFGSNNRLFCSSARQAIGYLCTQQAFYWESRRHIPEKYLLLPDTSPPINVTDYVRHEITDTTLAQLIVAALVKPLVGLDAAYIPMNGDTDIQVIRDVLAHDD